MSKQPAAKRKCDEWECDAGVLDGWIGEEGGGREESEDGIWKRGSLANTWNLEGERITFLRMYTHLGLLAPANIQEEPNT